MEADRNGYLAKLKKFTQLECRNSFQALAMVQEEEDEEEVQMTTNKGQTPWQTLSSCPEVKCWLLGTANRGS